MGNLTDKQTDIQTGGQTHITDKQTKTDRNREEQRNTGFR